MPAIRTCALFLMLTSVALADELRTLGGKTVTGTLLRITDAEIAFKTSDGDVTTPLAQALLVELRSQRESAGSRTTGVRLLDDTALQCAKVIFDRDKVELQLFSGIVLQVPLNQVVSVFQDAHDPVLRKKWDELAAERVKRDRIIVINAEGLPNVMQGTLGEVDAKGEKIDFRKEDGSVVPVVLGKLNGMIFYRTEVVQETPTCRIIDILGNNLSVSKVNYDGKVFSLKTTFGSKIELKNDAVAKLDFNLGKLTFLSDMEPAKVLEKSGAGLVTRYRKDANLDGEPIILEKQYVKGLAMHAHTELEYNLAGKYKEFKAILGVDVRTGADSKALVTVFCDGEKRFSQAATAKPQPVAVNVKDVNVLKIVVSSSNFLDLHDHATLAEARVSQ